MAVDKLVDSSALNEGLTLIANAVRARTGDNSPLSFPNEFASAIGTITGKDSVTWHQNTDAVRNYISDVVYDPSDYSTTRINDYAPSPANPSYDTKPIGKTVEGITFYNEVPNALTPFVTATKAGTLKPLDHVRWINSLTSNFRDLGGWACDGGTVKYGLAYRSGNLNPGDEDLVINKLGIRTEIDLAADDIPAYPGKLRYICHPTYAMYTLNNLGAWQTNLRALFDSILHNEPVIFHCSMGADRTGTFACIVLGILGVSLSDIDKDYELTSFYSERARNRNYQGGTSDWAHLIAEIVSRSGSTFRDKCVDFVLLCGISIDDINAFRAAMVDGTPAVLSASLSTYTVSTNLTKCSISNTSSSANQYSSFEADIIPEGRNTIEQVYIEMGGIDVKGDVYTEVTFPSSVGHIRIDRVIGNVVITAVAGGAVEPVELFDSANSVINVRFNSSGNTTAKNGNFVTDFIPVELDSAEPWILRIQDTTSPSKFRAVGSNEAIVFCKADKSIVNTNYGRLTINTSTTGTNTLCKHDDTNGIYIVVNQVGAGSYIPSNFFDLSAVKYIRVCLTFDSSAIPSKDSLSNVSMKSDKIVA